MMRTVIIDNGVQHFFRVDLLEVRKNHLGEKAFKVGHQFLGSLAAK